MTPEKLKQTVEKGGRNGHRGSQGALEITGRCCRGVRRIIQISTASSALFAFSDDGTVWGFTANHPGWM